MHFWTYVDINCFYYLHIRNVFLKLGRVLQPQAVLTLGHKIFLNTPSLVSADIGYYGHIDPLTN